MNLQKRLALIGLLAMTLLFTGCASFERVQPAPRQATAISVKLTADELSGWTDLPAGAHRIPDSQVIVSGHQKGGMGGVLFGLIGVALQHAVNTGIGQDAVKSVEGTLKINLTNQARTKLDSLLEEDRFKAGFTTTPPTANSPVLSVTTALVLTFVNDTEIRPYIVLKASLREMTTKEPVWSTRYISSSGVARPLTGEFSWTANEGAYLKQSIESNLARALTFMLRDVATPTPRDPARLIWVQAGFPFVKRRLETIGYQLAEDDASITIVPKLSDVIIFTGINILDKQVTTFRPAADADAALKLLD